MIDLSALRKEQLRGVYALRQLGSEKPQVLIFFSMEHYDLRGWFIPELFDVVILRTAYLDSILPCQESKNVIGLMEHAKTLLPKLSNRGVVREVVPGHIYQMWSGGKALTDKIRFVRRSSGSVKHPKEWPGLQTQELLRAMIDRLMLHRVHWQMADLCRQALWEYEARAYRRKRQEYNRQDGHHTETLFPYPSDDIEHMPIGKDGHIPYLESEILYYANFGACDAEAIPGINPFEIERDPVYRKIKLDDS